MILFLFFGCSSLQTFENTNDDPEDSLILSNKEIWVYHPVGIQCEYYFFSHLKEATDQLKRFKIDVLDSKESSKMVRFVCGNYTSEIYIAQIRSIDLDKAIRLGWKFYEDRIDE